MDAFGGSLGQILTAVTNDFPSKLSSVTQELPSWNLFKGTLPGSTTTSSDTQSPSRDDIKYLSVKCGSRLLAKWQDAWKEIHDANRDNAEAASRVQNTIHKLAKEIESQDQNVNRLNECLSSLPSLQHHMSQLTAGIGSLCEDFDILEAGFFELEHLKDSLQLQRQMDLQRQALSQHRERRKVDLEAEKVKAAADHEVKVKAFETRLHADMRARQSAFEAAFDRDLVAFKQAKQDKSVEAEEIGVPTNVEAANELENEDEETSNVTTNASNDAEGIPSEHSLEAATVENCNRETLMAMFNYESLL